MEDRSWAIDLDQVKFEQEWVKRFPFSDVVPDVNLWTHPEEKPSTFIDKFNPEQLVNDDAPPNPLRIEIEDDREIFIATCRGCQKEFKKHKETRAMQALKTHQMHCKDLKRKVR